MKCLESHTAGFDFIHQTDNAVGEFYISSLLLLSRFSHVRLCAILWTIAQQAPLSMGFSKQEYWSELPVPSPGDPLNLGTAPASLCLLPWQVGSLPLVPVQET